MRARAIELGSNTLTRRGRWSIVLVAVAVAFAGQLMPETTKAATLADVPDSAVKASCDPNSKVDQTPAFLAWLRSHDDPGTTIRFKAGGCYWMNNVIDIHNLHDLTFDGNGAVFKTTSAGFDTRALSHRFDRAWPRPRSMWRLEGGYNLILKNMTIVGSNGGPNAAIDPRTGKPFVWGFYCPAPDPPNIFCLEGQAGITLWGVNPEGKGEFGAKIDGVTIKYVFGIGIELAGWGAHALNRDIQVHNSKIERTGSMAIVAHNVDGAMFQNNILRTPRRSMFNIEPPTPGMPSLNVTVDRNTMIDDDDPTDSKSGHYWMFANGGNTDARVENITFSNNELINEPVSAYINLGPDLKGRHTSRRNIRIINNRSNIDWGAPFPDQAPIRAIGVVGLEVTGNTQAIQPNQRNHGVSVYGIDGATSDKIVVRDNHFANSLSALYTDPAIADTTVCANRVGLDDLVDKPCVKPAARPTAAPTIVSPGAGSTLADGSILATKAAAHARRVEYLISGGWYFVTGIGDAKKTPYGWIYTWGTKKIPDGTYWVKARAYDPLGNHVDGPQVRFTVRNNRLGR